MLTLTATEQINIIPFPTNGRGPAKTGLFSKRASFAYTNERKEKDKRSDGKEGAKVVFETVNVVGKERSSLCLFKKRTKDKLMMFIQFLAKNDTETLTLSPLPQSLN